MRAGAFARIGGRAGRPSRQLLRCRLGAFSVFVAAPAILVSLPAAASAQLRIQTDVDTTLITVGDRIQMTVTVEHPAGTSVVWPDSLDLEPFEVLGAQAAAPQAAGQNVRSTARFVLTAFDLGELEIPSFDVDVLLADGGRETLSTDRFGIEVVSVGADETGDIRDIRGPLSIPIGVISILFWVLILLAIIGALTYAWRRRRRRPEAAPVVPQAPPRPAHEVALEALARIEASDMLVRGEVKEYHIAVSEVIRRYVEARFAVTALEMTTWEVLDGLERAGVDEDVRSRLRRFLDRCDMVKFAKVRPTSDASREVLSDGRALVQHTAKEAIA